MSLKTVPGILFPATAVSSAAGGGSNNPEAPLPKFIAKWRKLFPIPAGYQQNVRCSTYVAHTCIWHAHGPAECLLSNLVETNLFDTRGKFQLTIQRPPLLGPFGELPQHHLKAATCSWCCLKTVEKYLCLDASTSFSVSACDEFRPFPCTILEGCLQTACLGRSFR